MLTGMEWANAEAFPELILADFLIPIEETDADYELVVFNLYNLFVSKDQLEPLSVILKYNRVVQKI